MCVKNHSLEDPESLNALSSHMIVIQIGQNQSSRNNFMTVQLLVA